MKIQLAAHLVRANFNKDGSVSMNFKSGQEIADDKVIYLVNAARKDELGWIVWSPNEIQVEDIPKEQAEENQKTAAQRLRATIFVWWQQQGGKGDFEVIYREKMEKFISRVKAELD
tara:strand:+ start:814 stop:1161 length:348 start_codon:yes stop_codon:yes gene_type:complete